MQYIRTLPKNIKHIPKTLTWIDRNGNFFGKETRIINGIKHKHYGEFFKYSTFVNNHNGYVYINLKYIDENNKLYIKQRRVHILIAECFIENPNHLPVVGHKNNIKTDNRVENLYWTTIKENTQKAVDDGLMVNKKGYEDSQSKPVNMYNTYTNELIKSFGSCCEAEKETGILLGTILRQAKYHRPVRKPYYFRFQDDESILNQQIVVQYDFKTKKPIKEFVNIGSASRETGITDSTIETQCKNNKIPKWSKSGYYFLYR